VTPARVTVCLVSVPSSSTVVAPAPSSAAGAAPSAAAVAVEAKDVICID